MKLDDKLGEAQRKKLELLRMNRNTESVNLALESIRNAAKSNDNLFPLVLDAIRSDCTLGEIMQAMKDEFGTWMAPSGF
jgi:methylmalonyl-CoA mutase N-terminal domain/subunit